MRETRLLEETSETKNTTQREREQGTPPRQPVSETCQPTGGTPYAQEEPPIVESTIVVLDDPEEQECVQHFFHRNLSLPLLLVAGCLLCLSLLLSTFLLAHLSPVATVMIIPTKHELTITAALPFAQVKGRVLPSLTLTQAQTAPSSGRGHQDAKHARGTITFYNGSFTSQPVAAGTILTGADGVQVVTDQVAMLPAGNPPIYGQVTVAAHALQAGLQGNIPTLDIRQACCLVSVFAENTQAFTGGQNARDYKVVTKQDIDTLSSKLKTVLLHSVQAALQAQLSAQEEVVTPIPCNPTVTANHRPEDEAADVRVTVSETCTAEVYNTGSLQTLGITLLTKEAAQRLGTGYTVVGRVQTAIIQASGTNMPHGSIQILLLCKGTWVYQIGSEEQQHLAKLIVGQNKTQAIRSLLHSPGVQAVIMEIPYDTTLPGDPNRIRIVVVYQESQIEMV
jgi:hypothetical protein